MKKNSWRIGIVLLCFVAVVWLLLPSIVSLLLTHSTQDRCRISFFLTPNRASVRSFQWRMLQNPQILGKIRTSLKLPWRSFIFGQEQLLAFSGPGQIVFPKGQNKLELSGEVNGNFKTGALRITGASVKVENLGRILLSGNLSNWGKENVTLSGRVNDFMLSDLRRALNIPQMPFSGKVDGMVDLVISKDKIKLFKFDLDFRELIYREKSTPFSGHVKGSYDLVASICTIENAIVKSPSGGTLELKGLLGKEEFALKFKSEGLDLEEVVSQLPEAWQKKFQFKANGNVSLDCETRWETGSLPEFAGRMQINGNLEGAKFSCGSFSLTGINRTSSKQPDFYISLRDLTFGNMRIPSAGGTLYPQEGRYLGEISFSLWEGKGVAQLSIPVTVGKSPKLVGRIDLHKMQLEKFARSLNPEIVFTGLIDIVSFIELARGHVFVQASFENIKGKPGIQKLNFGALKALANFGSANIAGSISRGDFYYRRLAGIITYNDGFLTVEGRAKSGQKYDYLMTSGYFSGINIIVDRTGNTIRIEDLKNRIQRAMKTVG